MEFPGLEGFRGVCAGAEQPPNPQCACAGGEGGWQREEGSERRSCSPLVCRWHVVNLPGLRGKDSGLFVCLKTEGSFVRCLGRAAPLLEDKVTKQQHADWRRYGHWSKGLKKKHTLGHRAAPWV